MEPPRRHENSVRVTNRAVKRELTKEGGAKWRRLAYHRKSDSHRNRQVEAAALLPQLCRCKVDRQPLPGKLQPTVADGRSNALTRLLYRRRGESDQHECDLSVRAVGLNLHTTRIKTNQKA